MRRKWILIGLAAGLLTAAITGSVALAWGGPGHGWGWGRGDHEEHKTAVASKVAAILGTDQQETADAIEQANREVREEAQDAALKDFASRVATTLGTDADATADALKQVAEEMRGEALESKLQDAIDDGRMTEEEAQEIRDKVASAYWHGKGFGFKGDDNAEDFANRVGAILEVGGDDAADAIEQARAIFSRKPWRAGCKTPSTAAKSPRERPLKFARKSSRATGAVSASADTTSGTAARVTGDTAAGGTETMTPGARRLQRPNPPSRETPL